MTDRSINKLDDVQSCDLMGTVLNLAHLTHDRLGACIPEEHCEPLLLICNTIEKTSSIKKRVCPDCPRAKTEQVVQRLSGAATLSDLKISTKAAAARGSAGRSS